METFEKINNLVQGTYLRNDLTKIMPNTLKNAVFSV